MKGQLGKPLNSYPLRAYEPTCNPFWSGPDTALSGVNPVVYRVEVGMRIQIVYDSLEREQRPVLAQRFRNFAADDEVFGIIHGESDVSAAQLFGRKESQRFVTGRVLEHVQGAQFAA